MAPPPRSRSERRADTLALLTGQVDCWVASASASGDAYLVPLSFVWNGSRLVLATAAATRTARNLERAGRIRLALGTTRDVVMIDGVVDIVDGEAIAPALADAFARGTGWEPRQEAAPYVYLLVTPRRIQAWREENELPDRTLMEDGRWIEAAEQGES
jgi:hypothetical protein